MSEQGDDKCLNKVEKKQIGGFSNKCGEETEVEVNCLRYGMMNG